MSNNQLETATELSTTTSKLTENQIRSLAKHFGGCNGIIEE